MTKIFGFEIKLKGLVKLSQIHSVSVQIMLSCFQISTSSDKRDF